jgi:hypothetical protein
MMLSLIQGEPDGHEQIEIKIRKDGTQIVSHGKTPCQEQRPHSIEAHPCDQFRRFESCIIEITCVFVI